MNVSVSILCYNYGRFLEEAIESVLTQRLPSDVTLDVLVLDDGSTDDTPEICQRYADKVRVHRSKNEGFAATLSKAISLPRGDLVFLLDADDAFCDGKIESVVSAFSDRVGYVEHAQRWMSCDGALLDGVHAGGNTSTICVRRELAMSLLPIENEVALHALKFAGFGVTLTKPLTRYRLHDLSMTQRKTAGSQNDYLQGVHFRLANQFKNHAAGATWLMKGAAQELADRFEAMGWYNALEAALERGQRRLAFRALSRLLVVLIRHPALVSSVYIKMIGKTFLGRPSFRRIA